MKANIQAAKVFGNLAFASGKTRIPACDPNIMEMIKGRQIGDERTLPELNAWLEGWNEAFNVFFDKKEPK
jgi:hypothetical protein